MLNELMTKEGEEEIRQQLTLMAAYMDEVMAKSEAEAASELDYTP